MKSGLWMVADAVLCSVALALLAWSLTFSRPSGAIGLVALSTFLEDAANAASGWPESVASSCGIETDAAGSEIQLSERLAPALNAFPSTGLLMRCEESGREIVLSPLGGPEKSVLSSGRVIVDSGGNVFRVTFFASAGDGS